MSVGASLRIGSPEGTLRRSADLNREISLVEVTLVEPINSPILSWVKRNGR